MAASRLSSHLRADSGLEFRLRNCPGLFHYYFSYHHISSVSLAAIFHSQCKRHLGLFASVNIILLSRGPAGLLLREWWCLSLTIPNVLVFSMHQWFDLFLIKTITLKFYLLRDSLLLYLIGGQVWPGAELYLVMYIWSRTGNWDLL